MKVHESLLSWRRKDKPGALAQTRLCIWADTLGVTVRTKPTRRAGCPIHQLMQLKLKFLAVSLTAAVMWACAKPATVTPSRAGLGQMLVQSLADPKARDTAYCDLLGLRLYHRPADSYQDTCGPVSEIVTALSRGFTAVHRVHQTRIRDRAGAHPSRAGWPVHDFRQQRLHRPRVLIRKCSRLRKRGVAYRLRGKSRSATSSAYPMEVRSTRAIGPSKPSMSSRRPFPRSPRGA